MKRLFWQIKQFFKKFPEKGSWAYKLFTRGFSKNLVTDVVVDPDYTIAPVTITELKSLEGVVQEISIDVQQITFPILFPLGKNIKRKCVVNKWWRKRTR